MYRVEVTEEAEKELIQFFESDPRDANKLYAALEEIDMQERPPDEILSFINRDFGNFEIKIFLEALNLDGVKIWSLKAFREKSGEKKLPVRLRAYFAPNHKEKRYIVLAILERDVSYATHGKRYQRVLADYVRLGCGP